MKQLNQGLFCASFLLSTFAFGQTNPTAYDLSIGDFSFTGFSDGTSTEYPANTQGWRFESEPVVDFVGVPSDNRDLVNNASNPTSGSIKNEEANGISFLNSGSNGIGALVVALNTSARENITLSWLAEDIRDGSTRENGIKLQYRIGESGDFTDVENTTYISNPTDFSAAANFEGIVLPAEVNNQDVVQVRWLYYFSSGGGARDRIRLDEIVISSNEMMGSLVPVTFQVDMSNETVDPLGAGISGSFNGFDFEAMEDLGDGLFSITLELEPGSTIEYKFRNGDAFENVPDACGEGPFNNRTLVVPASATSLDVVCYSACEACPLPGEMYELTLRVNASQLFDIDPAGIHIAGNFNDYTPQSMTNIGILNYTFTVMVEEGTTVLWKFLNGNTFTGQESVPEACGAPDGFGGFNRSFVMPSEDTVLENVCFSSCSACGVLVESEVTFRVDVSQIAEIDPAGIHIGGNFTEFITEPMLDEGNGIYSYTFFAAQSQPLEWKYINGSTYDGAETVPASCGTDDGFGGFNRSFITPAEDTTLDIVCFSSCAACIDPGEDFNLTLQVDASQIDIDPAGIHIAGTFNGFTPEPMTDAGDGIYTFTASVEGGTTVLWKYLNSVNFDGQESVPGACGADDGFGGFNRTLEMPIADTVLDAVCFASCEVCSDPGEEFDLVFQVDASQIDIDPAGIHIAGTFNGFSPEPMQDSGDGIYTFSALVTAGTTVLFKYTNGPTFDGVESVPAACGSDDGFGGFNRFFTMPAAPTALDIVCFSSCVACIDPGEEFALVFQVDASQIDIDPAGIHIGGSFNGFNPEPMQDGGSGIYTFTANVASGTTVLWKYTNGPTFDGAEDVPSACGITDGFGGFNRTFDMPAAPTVLDIVCFSSCEACEDPGVFFDLTFQVDASQVEIDPAGIYIAGSFNGFAPEAMTDAGNGLYTFTAAVAAGSEVLWKYLNGSEFTGAEDVPGECGEDDGFGGFNRSILMPAQNAVLSVVCFSSCVECLIGVNDATLLDAINVYPNPNTGVFNILSPVAGDAQISIYELSGRLVYNEQRHMEADQPTEINTSIAASGFYLVEMRIGEDRFITKITVM